MKATVVTISSGVIFADGEDRLTLQFGDRSEYNKLDQFGRPVWIPGQREVIVRRSELGPIGVNVIPGSVIDMHLVLDK